MAQPARQLGFWDVVFLVVGSIIGSGIFVLPGGMLQDTNLSASAVMLAWVGGAVVAVSGGLMFAQLGAAFPKAGGQVAFLRDATGPMSAFLFNWTGFTVVQSGTIAAVAIVFAERLGEAVGGLGGHDTAWGALVLPGYGKALVAMGIIALLTAVNILGVRRAALVNNAATVSKLLALLLVVAGAFALGSNAGNFSEGSAPLRAATLSGFLSAMTNSLFAYDGFAQATFVAAEVKDAKRVVPRAIIVASLTVAAVYLAATAAYLYVLPTSDVSQESLLGTGAIAVEATEAFASGGAADLLVLAIAVSTFGTVNSYILASPRLYSALAQAKEFPRAFGRLGRYGTPTYGLWYQGVWSCLLLLTGGYIALTNLVVFGLYLFYVVTVVAYFRLRWQRPEEFPGTTRLTRTLTSVPAAFFGLAALGIVGYVYLRVDLAALGELHGASDVIANTSLLGLILVASGLVVYLPQRRATARARAAAGAGDVST